MQERWLYTATIQVSRNEGEIQRNLLAKFSSILLNQFANKSTEDSKSNRYVPAVATAPADRLWLVRRNETSEDVEISFRWNPYYVLKSSSQIQLQKEETIQSFSHQSNWSPLACLLELVKYLSLSIIYVIRFTSLNNLKPQAWAFQWVIMGNKHHHEDRTIENLMKQAKDLK